MTECPDTMFSFCLLSAFAPVLQSTVRMPVLCCALQLLREGEDADANAVFLLHFNFAQLLTVE